MEIVNTPEDRFENLPDYDFIGEYVEVGDGLKMHFIDAGNPLATETILLLHGEPSWSYLYRHMIPILIEAGYRVLAPDLIGFGKSSKPTETSDYTYATHVSWTNTWLESVNPGTLTMFAQDWGGLIGLRLVDLSPNRFSRICISNTGLPTGDHKATEAFLKWQAFSQKANPFPFEKVMQGATEKELSDAELAAYKAPFPDFIYTAGARIFPALVPTKPDDPESENNRQAWRNTFMKWEKPFLTLFGDKDPVTNGGEKVWQKLVPGAKGQKHQIIEGGGHFIQEDKGHILSNLLIDFINDNSLKMAETYEVFNVKKQEFIMSEWTDESQEAISDGEVKLQILQFAYTSNNTTYAVAGDYIGYWKFFPSSVGKDWGIIPCWGLAKVTESQVDTINVGEQFYGFFPMATHLIVQPCQIRPDGFTDVVEHRSNLPVIYNRYVRCEGDPFYDSEKEAEQLLFRPLFTTSFLIDYMLQESSYFGATQIILTSASSKTALGLAHSLKNGSSNQRIIGLTSNRNLDFVKSLGYYDEVLAYDQYDQIKNQPSCIVDFSGNNDLQADLQTLLGDNLKYNCLVGMVHWSERTGEKKQQNKGIMFFAPTYAQNLVKEIGFSAFSEKVSSEFHSFVAQSESWMNILYHENKEALEALHNAITLGKINPKEGHIVKL